MLNNFFHRVVDDMLNPFLLDNGAIWALTHGVEILGKFHRQQSTRRYNFAKSVRLPDLVHLIFCWFKTDNNATCLHMPCPQVITNWKADLTPPSSTVCREAFARHLSCPVVESPDVGFLWGRFRWQTTVVAVVAPRRRRLRPVPWTKEISRS